MRKYVSSPICWTALPPSMTRLKVCTESALSQYKVPCAVGKVVGQYEGDVQVTTPANGDLLIRNQTSGKWVNAPLTAGTAISVTNTAGAVSIANTAPDQVVAITGAGTTTVTGTYPNFTVTSNDQYVGTVTSVAATAGTGISVTGSPITKSGTLNITNTAPDQIVALTGAGTTTISGTYPNFTITSTDQYTGTVTAVTGTAPIASTGGTTPAISIPKATGSVDGYLSSTDWTTFNNKQPAGAYLTAVTADAPLSGSGTSASHLIISQANTSTNGYLSSTDWNTFNGKANAFTYTTSYIPYGQGTTTPNQASNFTFDGTTQTAPIQRASNGIIVNSKTVSASYSIASGDSAMSVGPVTVASGQSVTVASGSRWVVL